MDIKEEQFIVYGSGKLIEDNQFKKAIIGEFSMPKDRDCLQAGFHYEDSILEIFLKSFTSLTSISRSPRRTY